MDPGSPLDEVLADLELMAARVAQLSAQAEDLAAVAQELGVQPGDFLEVREAETVARVSESPQGRASRGCWQPASQRRPGLCVNAMC